MNYVDSNIDSMIAESISTDSTVTVTERIDTQEWAWLVNGLADRSGDWVRITAGDSRLSENVMEVREYWGTDEDGDDWRIHVHSRS